MASLEQALSLARQGFHCFPLQRNSKLPAIKNWQNLATTDEEQITRWWTDPVLGLEEDWNIGICTTRFNCEEALLAIDVDNKGDKNGDAEIIRLELEGNDFPSTREHSTPTSGRHFLYRLRGREVPNSASKIAPGVDVRGRGGFVVAPGSSIDGKPYTGNDLQVATAPDWLIARCAGAPSRPDVAPVQPAADIDRDRATRRAIEYLKTAPVAIEGDGGDQTTYIVAAKLKDLGLDEETAFVFMADHWNERCDPPWDEADLTEKVRNAYAYGKNPPGVDAPETQFDAVQNENPTSDLQGSPMATLNTEYAFIERGAFVLRETLDHKGRFVTDHLSVAQMHHVFSNKFIQLQKGKRTEDVPWSKAWMEWRGRRQFKGVVFSPEKAVSSEWYNLWRGFRVQPAENSKHPAVEAFKEHALKNVCDGDHGLYQWLMSYFAHLIQRPWEKPLVAIVFKGRKGTGKNALIERVGHLIGHHFIVADDNRYLIGNFNSHLESCLFMVLDEAAWAGDKRAEGRLKGLITGTEHNIERKGEEPYTVDNLTRIAIIGNEDWLVPAGEDERRYAVFNVGDGRKQDRKFFHDMRVGMEEGGYAHLLHFLQNFPISCDINEAPNTQGLVDQKLESLQPLDQWWMECLREESILGSDMDGWPETIQKKRLRDSMYDWLNKRGVRNWKPSEDKIGKRLALMAPSVVAAKRMENGAKYPIYKLEAVEVLRAEFETFVKGKVKWE